jgi:diguanylate cyclase (GGDEF)-like protein
MQRRLSARSSTVARCGGGSAGGLSVSILAAALCLSHTHSLWAANGFVVELAAINVHSPQRVGGSYRLKCYEDSWSGANSNCRVPAYSHRTRRHHLLQLRTGACHGASVAGIVPVSSDVPRQWYQTLWCRVAGFLWVLGTALLCSRSVLFPGREQKFELPQVVCQSAELREGERQLEQLVLRDPLTGFANRCKLIKRLDDLTEQGRSPVTFALLLLDLDRFKIISELLGREAGDALLAEIARRLRQAVGDPDGVFRLGGDEFAALVVNFSNESTIEAICSKILQEVFAIVHLNGFEMISSPSIGISQFPLDGMTTSELFKIADAALFEAKYRGRNTWRWGGVPRQQEAEFG